MDTLYECCVLKLNIISLLPRKLLVDFRKFPDDSRMFDTFMNSINASFIDKYDQSFPLGIDFELKDILMYFIRTRIGACC